MDSITTRPYSPGDQAACLQIFDSNTPKFLAPEERAEFVEFLSSAGGDDCPHLVLVQNGVIVACGGLFLRAEKHQAALSWGMVDRPLHKQRLGARLTTARIDLARNTTGIDELTLSTSQHTYGFYERFGFIVTKITQNHFAPGLHCYDMALRL